MIRRCINAARDWLADRLYPVWPALAFAIVPTPEVTTIKTFDDWVRVFGGPDGRTTTEQSMAGLERYLSQDGPVMIRVTGPEASGGLKADIKDHHGNVVGTMESKSAGYFPTSFIVKDDDQ